MTSLDELKKENARLKAERENRGLKRRLEVENRVLSGKGSAKERITAVFRRSAATTYPAVKGAAITVGKGAKRYAEYRMGSQESERPKPKYSQGRKQTYYKKVGPRSFRKVTVYKSKHEESKPKKRRSTHSNFGKSYFGGGSDILGTTSSIHRQSSDLFRRTM
jgi:hypothetical protein